MLTYWFKLLSDVVGHSLAAPRFDTRMVPVRSHAAAPRSPKAVVLGRPRLTSERNPS